jgi:hypothetical protein
LHCAHPRYRKLFTHQQNRASTLHRSRWCILERIRKPLRAYDQRDQETVLVQIRTQRRTSGRARGECCSAHRTTYPRPRQVGQTSCRAAETAGGHVVFVDAAAVASTLYRSTTSRDSRIRAFSSVGDGTCGVRRSWFKPLAMPARAPVPPMTAVLTASVIRWLRCVASSCACAMLASPT